MSVQKNALLFGYGEADITPSQAVETIGFGRPEEWSQGVLAPLLAQVSIWQQEGVEGLTRCCLAAVDHIGFSRSHGERLRTALGQVLSISTQQVMVCFSHTHSAPNDSLNPGYFEEVCRRICIAAGEALASLSPVETAWGNGWADIGLNRRANTAALDRRVGVLQVNGAQTGQRRLLLLRLTAHANVLKADNYLLSPDYFGSVRQKLQARFGCPVLVTQGASGNIAPKYFSSTLTPPDAADSRFVRSPVALSDMAELVSGAVAAVLPGLHPAPSARLSMTSAWLTLPADVPGAAQAQQVATDAKQYCGIDGTAWLAETARLREAGVTQQEEKLEVQYFTVGEGCLCGVSDEVMCEMALELVERLKNAYFYFGGYTNGCGGYFPTAEEFDQGGYEVYWSWLIYFPYFGRVYPLKRDSAAALVNFIAQQAPAWLTQGRQER